MSSHFPHETTLFGEDPEKLQIVHFRSQIGLILEAKSIASSLAETFCRIACLFRVPSQENYEKTHSCFLQASRVHQALTKVARNTKTKKSQPCCALFFLPWVCEVVTHYGTSPFHGGKVADRAHREAVHSGEWTHAWVSQANAAVQLW